MSDNYTTFFGRSLVIAILFFALTPDLVSAQAGSEDEELNSAFRFSPLRMATGSFQLEYERQVADKFTLNFMGMGTYLSRNGLGSWYLKSLGRDQFADPEKKLPEGVKPVYNASIMSGAGLIVQGRQYYYAHDDEPKGLYFGPTLMYRNLGLVIQRKNSRSNLTIIEEEQQRRLSIFKAGLITGAQLPIISKRFVFDAYGGAVFRMSSYNDEAGPSDYNAWTALDHSGVTFTFGLSVGMVFGKGEDSGSSDSGGGKGSSAPSDL